MNEISFKKWHSLSDSLTAQIGLVNNEPVYLKILGDLVIISSCIKHQRQTNQY